MQEQWDLPNQTEVMGYFSSTSGTLIPVGILGLLCIEKQSAAGHLQPGDLRTHCSNIVPKILDPE